jgi:nanoRNase/pAp phosphatase (c-di-AMP/oligoRNAs hydrolase)
MGVLEDMALTNTQQIKKLIEAARHVLIVFRPDTRGDDLASAVALAQFAGQSNCQVEIVSDNVTVPPKLQFLGKMVSIAKRLPHVQKFMITIDVADAGVRELSYDVKDQKLHIFITPKSGFLTKEHIRTAQSEFRYDLIFVVGSPDFQSLGGVYERNRELFSKITTINIDHKPNNEHFGTINMVDLTASSCAEIVANMISDIDEHAITEPIATALLTGMIIKTNSFKEAQIKPHSLSLASTLVSQGADREFIIRQLYQTKTLAMLRLWGETLAHLNYEKSLGLVWSTITRDDFVRSGASEPELYDIVDELILNSPEAKMTLILHEHKQKDVASIHGVFHCTSGLHATKITEKFSSHGDATRASFALRDKTLAEAQQTVIEEIKSRVAPT